MYMDIDSIMFGNATAQSKQQRTKRWTNRIDQTVMTREDLCAIYGMWADDAAESDFLDPDDGCTSFRLAYVA